ncbi:MAG: hypothetical protein PHV34_08775 [Verrucomicrobiae bacterium]|nr:hypothetical protein [Verrucomicrobiae bacterium]
MTEVTGSANQPNGSSSPQESGPQDRAELQPLRPWKEMLSRRKRDSRKPIVLLPDSTEGIRIIDTASDLGEALGRADNLFVKGKAASQLVTQGGKHSLEPVRDVRLRSLAEEHASLHRYTKDREGNVTLTPALLTSDMAKAIMEAPQFQGGFREIVLLSPCPVLVVRPNGNLDTVVQYDPESRVMAFGQAPEIVPSSEARETFLELLADYRFATDADRSRAAASLLAPALVHGGIIERFGGRPPMFLWEANASQAGKGYGFRLTTTVYNHEPATISLRPRMGGVGSIAEDFGHCLIRGYALVSFDNLRGKFDSQFLESFLTESLFVARVPYSPPVSIETRRVVLFGTSNEAELTYDLANRVLCIRILKQPIGYSFRRFDEGDLIAHVRANRGRYLGAIFSLVKAWWDARQPRTDEARHDFRPACQVLDWIVQNLLGLPPLLDGYEEVRQRMTNPSLTWLRKLALAVEKQRRRGKWLKSSELVGICEQTGLEIPGTDRMRAMSDEKFEANACQMIGRRLKLCFGDSDTVTVDRVQVTRIEEDEIRQGHGIRTTKSYKFDPLDPAAVPVTVPDADTPEEGPVATVAGGPFDFNEPEY